MSERRSETVMTSRTVIVIGALEIALAWGHRDAFARLFVSAAGGKRHPTGTAEVTSAWEVPS
jgi:hypothetical protein